MPKYQLEIGLKGDTIEHVKEVEAKSLDEAYEIANSWAIEEYCIAHATPLDKEGELMEEFGELVKSIRSTMRMLATNQFSGEERHPERAEAFLREMKKNINAALTHAIESEGDRNDD